MEYVFVDWFGCVVLFAWFLLIVVVRVVSDIFFGLLLGMVWGVEDVCSGFVFLIFVLFEDVIEVDCIEFVGCICLGIKFGFCIVVVALFVDVILIGVRVIRLGGIWEVGLFSSRFLFNWFFVVGMSGIRLGVIWFFLFIVGELFVFNCFCIGVKVIRLGIVEFVCNFVVFVIGWMFGKGLEVVWLFDFGIVWLIDDGLVGVGINVIFLGVILLVGLVGVIFIGIVNIFILLIGFFLVVVWDLFILLLFFFVDGVDVGFFVILFVYI